MHYRVRHLTCYRYSQPVALKPHVLRLQPRSDGAQQLTQFQLSVEPEAISRSPLVDLDSNAAIALWFGPEQLSQLTIETISTVTTCRANPFDYLMEPWAVNFPLDYPASLLSSLQPYLQNPLFPAIAPGVVELSQNLLFEVQGNVGYFLTALTQTIYETCEYTVRDTGPPHPAGVTWAQKRGSCRDLAVLFMAACRSLGLAARFVSGYQEGDPHRAENELHAWGEVYVPGGGWRGFDPTLGLAVADRHIALAAGAHPSQAAPVTGALQEGSSATSILETQVALEILDSGAPAGAGTPAQV